MAGRREISFDLLSRAARSWSVATIAVALICLGGNAASAQQAAIVVVAPGNAVVTGFSGALPPVQIAPGADPNAITFIDGNGPTLRVVDLQHMGGRPGAQLVGVPKPFTFTAAQIGQVFGVALDDASPPNIYAAATSAYGLPIVASAPNGKPQHIRYGAPQASFMAGLWGPHGGPGSIWKIDGATGKVSLFANVNINGRANSSVALGGLVYDSQSKSLFVADRESGLIYRLALDGRILDHYDHGVTGRQAQGLPAVPWNPTHPLDITSPRFDSAEPATWNYAAHAPRLRAGGISALYYAVADGLQGSGTWLARPRDAPPLTSYFLQYDDEYEDAAARGHMGDVAIVRPCSPAPRPALGVPGGARPRTENPPPRQPPLTPPGGCPPNQLRRAGTNTCEPSCARPEIQIGGRCCSAATLAAGGACSNSSCPPGQTAIGPSNFCCSSDKAYTRAGGVPACCSIALVDGRCQPPPPPRTTNCSNGYVPVGGSCCLASQMTSTGTCCPAGQIPSGANKSQCVPLIPVYVPPLCCPRDRFRFRVRSRVVRPRT